MNGMNSVWIGYDPRETAAFAVARHSMIRNTTARMPIFGVVLPYLQRQGYYQRVVERQYNDDGSYKQLWDPISNAPMATEFAISRFFVPALAQRGWALFQDCDMLNLGNVSRLFEQVDNKYAVMCVKHNHVPEHLTKMDDQIQTQYARKNWSSVMLFNCDHPSNAPLMDVSSSGILNRRPGRDLHRFCWLEDHEIGELHPEWNYLVGYTSPKEVPEPKIVHFTEGIPTMEGHENDEFAEIWNWYLEQWALK